MKLKNIYIRDFGIFNNQYLEDLADGLVVIGGYNRSGKSSFLNIIKNLPYGLPQDGSIPPAREQYYIETEIKKDKKNYTLILEGFAKAKLNSSNNTDNDPAVDAAQLFNNLDRLTYQQLFTISLDELQNLSKVANNNKEEKKIFSLLLGAGLSELIKVPEIADAYFRDSVKIGGKLGSSNVSQFKSYYKQIKDAEKDKDKALKQLDEFIAKRKELAEKEKQLETIEAESENLRKKEFLFDLLKNNYQKYKEIEELKFKLDQFSLKDCHAKKCSRENYEQALSLKESYKDLKANYQREKNKLNSLTNPGSRNEFLEIIIEKSGQINRSNSKKEVIEEKTKNYLETKSELNEKRNILETELKEINSDWKQPLQEIKNIEIDKIKQKDLSSKIETFKNTKQELNTITKEKEELKEKLEIFQAEMKEYQNYNLNSTLRKTYLFGFLSFLLSIFLTFYNLSAALITLLATLFLSYIYFSTQYKPLLEKENERKEIESKIKANEKKIKKTNLKLEELKQKLEAYEQELNSYRFELGIKDSHNFDIISDYYRMIQDKKSRLNLLNKDQEKLRKKREELELFFNKIFVIIDEVYQYTDNQRLELDENRLLSKYQEILIEFENIADYLEIVNNFNLVAEKYHSLETEIQNFLNKEEIKFDNNLLSALNNYLDKVEAFLEFKKIEAEYANKKEKLSASFNSSDRIRSYLFHYFRQEEGIDNEIGTLQSFKKLFQGFSSLQAVEKAYNESTKELAEKKKEKKLLQEKVNSLKNEIEKLASSKDVQKAHQKINDARSDLRNLAERYAVNKSVYFILNKLRERFITRAEAELLKPAADILAEITSDEYKSIQTSGDIKDTEFKTVLADGKSFNSVDYLSRGTMEQLFLAVRLSRINEIKPHLPVVLDDSLVNFDHSHLFNTVKVISKLAKTHQVFLLSCHPHLIKCLKNISQSAQYWKLENGSFELTNADSLEKHLRETPFN